MANPLTVMLPIDPSKNVNELLAELAKNKAEIDAALTSIGTVHFARILFLDRSNDDLQPTFRPTLPRGKGPFVLGVITEFDGDFDAYIEDFTNKIGVLFDIALSYTTDGKSLVPVNSNVQEFLAYLKKHDLSHRPPNNALYNAYDLTVQQILCPPESMAQQA